MKQAIEKLRVSGGVYIWKYADSERNYPGWNLTVDLVASRELTQLFDLMDQCEWSTSKKIFTSLPTDDEVSVPNNRNGNAKWTTKPEITLSTRTTENPDYWVIREKQKNLEIHFGKQKLKKLKEAIISIPKGKGDFSISDDSDENTLTFWWRVRK